MIIKTYNSTYEVDQSNSRFRRLYGKHNAVNYMEDGEWFTYIHDPTIAIGNTVIFIYNLNDASLSEEKRLKTLRTSPVISILDGDSIKKEAN